MKTAVLLVILFLLFVQMAAHSQPTSRNILLRHTSASSGEEMYLAYCADCHGRSGMGNGPKARSLKVPATDLTTLARKNRGEFPAERVRETIRGDITVRAHLPKDMPAWGTLFAYVGGGSQAEVDLRVYHLTEYIHSLQMK